MYSVLLETNYSTPYSFEIYDYQKTDAWLVKYWSLSIVTSAAYIVFIFLGQKYMENRLPFKLQRPLLLWNTLLSVLSFVMVVRLGPELLHEIKERGVYTCLCSREGHTMVASFWIKVFAFSKLVEFGDTVFIVLKKQKLIFLHWYHHVTVCVYCIYASGDFDPASRLFAVINAFIHTIMYGYYAFKTLKVKIPTELSMVITSMQILQMLLGTLINVGELVLRYFGVGCDRPKGYAFWLLTIYFTYLILFANFFIQSYGFGKRKLKQI